MVGVDDDVRLMQLALRVAERGRGQTSPNPMVGAVIVDRAGIVVGLGYHRRAGEPHAEIHALQMAGERTHGGTLYCTLEPCAHVGRTGPCCVAVAEAGIRRAVVATRDPNPLVAGRGLAYLRERGLTVDVGVLGGEASRLNVAFFTAMLQHRPWVVLKMATSRDGAVAAAPGRRTALTSAPANRAVHRFRAEVDAIGIGSGTLLVDDPLLTVRGVFRERPLVRVIFDSRLRTPPGARILSTVDAGPVIIATSEDGRARAADRAARLEDAGAELIVVPPRTVVAVLRVLAGREVRSLVLEGGPTLHRAAWEAGVVDGVQQFVTPGELGPGAVPWNMPAACAPASLSDLRVTALGPDVLMEGACSQA